MVERPLVYLCEGCGALVASPQITAGRVFAALERERAAPAPIEIRVPAEAEDLALSVYAALGLRPTGDIYALAIALGLRQVGASKKPDARWAALDALQNDTRARPILSEEVLTRIDGLKAEWSLDRSGVARRLIAAAAASFGLISAG